MGGMGGGMMGGKGKGKQADANQELDPLGSGRIFVRGFDFGTTEIQLRQAMQMAGPIHAIYMVGKGEATIVFKQRASAEQAAASLNGSVLPGNSRYIDIILK